MPLRQTLPTRTDLPATTEQICSVAERWGISFDLARRLTVMSQALEFGVQIISGARSKREQDALERAGRPTAPWEVSTHSDEGPGGCKRLATGVDLSPLIVHQPAVVARFGTEATLAGLRWGGGSRPRCSTDFRTLKCPPGSGPLDLFPSDWQHVDLGPR